MSIQQRASPSVCRGRSAGGRRASVPVVSSVMTRSGPSDALYAHLRSPGARAARELSRPAEPLPSELTRCGESLRHRPRNDAHRSPRRARFAAVAATSSSTTRRSRRITVIAHATCGIEVRCSVNGAVRSAMRVRARCITADRRTVPRSSACGAERHSKSVTSHGASARCQSARHRCWSRPRRPSPTRLARRIRSMGVIVAVPPQA